MATDCNTTILVPPLSIKNYLPDGWNAWFTQFKIRSLVTKFPLLSDQEKIAVLLVKLGDEITPVFETFDVQVDKVSYEKLIELFSSYFRPAKTRHVFFSAKQKPQESFDLFAQRLTALSYPCCFGPLREGILRDVFLLNMADSYDKIRDNILSHYRDPSFQEALSLSKELFLRECNVLSDRRLIANDAGDLSHSRPVDATSASSKRKGIELDSSESIKDSHPSSAGSNTFIAFNARHSRATTPSHSNRDFGLNNARPAYDDKEVASPKLASAIRNALGKSDTQVPTLDFAFKCFSVNGATKPSDSGRSEAHANHKSLGEPKHAKSCSSEPISSKLSDSNFKPASVSNRLSKFSSQSKNVAKSPTPACELSSGGDRRSASDSATNYARELQVSQTPSNHSLNSWASKQENDIARVNSVEKDVSLGINSGSMFKHGNGQFFSDKADDHVPQKHFIETPAQNIELEPNPEPPVSKSRFSDVIIVFISEHDDTIHVCPVVKCQFLGTIENKLKELNEQNALEHITNISVGEKYAAPFNGDWYRAEIVSANMKKKSVCVSFCDYGNEENIPLSDLRLLPEEFQDLEPLSFPIKLPKGAPAVQSGSKLKIRPLSLEEDWSWAVELRTSPQ